MIFLYELQENYSFELKSEFQKVRPLCEGHTIFSTLQGFPQNLLLKIDQIVIICDKSIIDNTFRNTLKKYSPELHTYKSEPFLIEIVHRFPGVENLRNKQVNERLIGLIQSSTIIDFDIAKLQVKEYAKDKEELLVYIPFIKSLYPKFLLKFPTKLLHFMTDSTYSKIKGKKKYFLIDSNSFIRIDKLLKTICENNNLRNIDYQYMQQYIHPPFLENFNNGFFEELVKIIEEDNKRLHFCGRDEYLARRAINHLLISLPEDPEYYDMSKGLPTSITGMSSSVFFHFDRLEDPINYKKLYQRLKSISTAFYIILQSIKNPQSEYFSAYSEIALPDDKQIMGAITSIFFSMLIEKRLYNEDYYKLIWLATNNAFAELLKNCRNLGSLYEIIQKLEKVSYTDILENIGLWYKIDNEVLYASSDKDTNEPIIHELIYITHEKGWWKFKGAKIDEKFNDKNYLGIIYIIVIILHQKKFKKPIPVTKLRDISDEYAKKIGVKRIRGRSEKSLISTDDFSETDRKSINYTLRRTMLNHFLGNFIKSYIKYSEYSYLFINNKIECDTSELNLDDFLLK